jgi:serine/threonine protein kinase
MAMENPSLTHFGRYRVLEELGRGAMGVVYRAQDDLLQREVAIKTMLLPDDPADRAHYEARFRQEAKAAGGLNHHSIITIYDLGREGDWLYIAMELLRGTELRDLMTQGRLTLPQMLDIAAQVAAGLAAAHEHGVVHRDVKPSNVMVLEDGQAKIMDFGVARVQTSELKTKTGLMLGSPKYMSPEQVTGKAVDRRSDIFSLGALLYEMAAGVPPFRGDNLGELLSKITGAMPPPPSEVNRTVPSTLDSIIAKALQKEPDARYQDARELAKDLSECSHLLADATTQARAQSAAAQEAADPDATVGYAVTISTLAVERSQLASTTLSLLPSRHFDATAALQRLSHSVAEENRPATGVTRNWPGIAWVFAFLAATVCSVWIALA